MTVQNVRETSVMYSFSVLTDPRKSRNQLYCLFDIVTLSILAVLCGADDWVEVNLWSEANEAWLQEQGLCSNGIPSHDTFSRFFRYVDPLAFERCFISWTQRVAKAVGGIIALDGKTLCNSGNVDEKAIHLVSAFSIDNEMVLGQLATEVKSNEITAFPLLLQLLDLKDAIITIDAAGCQKEIAALIIDQGGDYVLSVKGNQESLHAEVVNFFQQAIQLKPIEAGCDYYCNEETSRNRIEKREVWATKDLEWLPQKSDWRGLKSLACLKSTRTIKGIKTVQFNYYISSLLDNAQKIGYAIRSHWAIENKLHWQLDVSYREDACKICKDHGAENFSVLRRATLNLLKADKKTKAGIKNKRSKAGWNKQYMLEILSIDC